MQLGLCCLTGAPDRSCDGHNTEIPIEAATVAMPSASVDPVVHEVIAMRERVATIEQEVDRVFRAVLRVLHITHPELAREMKLDGT